MPNFAKKAQTTHQEPKYTPADDPLFPQHTKGGLAINRFYAKFSYDALSSYREALRADHASQTQFREPVAAHSYCRPL